MVIICSTFCQADNHGDDSLGWFVTQAQIETIGDKRTESLYIAFGENQKALDWLEKAGSRQ